VRSRIDDPSPTRVTTALVTTTNLPAGGGVTEHPVTFVNRGYNDVSVSATDAAGNTTKRILRLWVDFLAPSVTTDMTNGTSIAVVPNNIITYTVRVSSMSATTLTLSNMPGQQFALPRGGGILKVQMPLRAGANTFDIHVTSEAGLTTTLSRTHNYGP
jgi:hypothetical protein